MKGLLIAGLLQAAALIAQSPFDGTWVAKLDTIRFSQRPEMYLLENGTYECSSCVPLIKVKADGKDYPVAGSPYFSTVAVRIINDRSVEITERQNDRIVYSETDTVSPDESTLVQKVSDLASSNGEPVSAVVGLKRVSQGPVGSSPISGSWQQDEIKSASENGISVTYRSTHDGLTALNPGGEGYTAKFDGRDYPIQGEPAHNTVSLKRINANTIVETDKQDGMIHYRLRLAVSPDGRSMEVTETDRERGTQMTYTMRRKPQ